MKLFNKIWKKRHWLGAIGFAVLSVGILTPSGAYGLLIGIGIGLILVCLCERVITYELTH